MHLVISVVVFDAWCYWVRYDMVLHLVTAAYGAEQFYTLANNAVRKSTPEQARARDDQMVTETTN